MTPFGQGGSGRRSFGGSGRRSFGGSSRRSSGGFGRRDSGGSDRRFGRPRMSEVTCDKCGERCEVPFKPTGDKPVYCRNCFRKDDAPRGNDAPPQYARELDEINRKLDKILAALSVD